MKKTVIAKKIIFIFICSFVIITLTYLAKISIGMQVAAEKNILSAADPQKLVDEIRREKAPRQLVFIDNEHFNGEDLNGEVANDKILVELVSLKPMSVSSYVKGLKRGSAAIITIYLLLVCFYLGLMAKEIRRKDLRGEL